MVRTNQGGSILGFIIIGVVMALLLLGGAYFVRHNLASVAEERPVAVNDQPTTDQPEEEKAEENTEGESNPPKEDDKKEQEDSAPAPAPAPQPVPTNTPSPSAQPENSTTEHLPTSGPGDMIAAGLLLSGAIGAIAAYLRSRALPSSL